MQHLCEVVAYSWVYAGQSVLMLQQVCCILLTILLSCQEPVLQKAELLAIRIQSACVAACLHWVRATLGVI